MTLTGLDLGNYVLRRKFSPEISDSVQRSKDLVLHLMLWGEGGVGEECGSDFLKIVCMSILCLMCVEKSALFHVTLPKKKKKKTIWLSNMIKIIIQNMKEGK